MTASNTAHPVITDTTTDHEPDIAVIRQIIADVEKAYNANDPDLMMAHFAHNASVVNAVGAYLPDWDTLEAANRTALAGFLRDEYVRYDVGDIRFVRPDVALAYKTARATTADGELIDVDPAMIALYVLVKQQDRWWVVARQNTLIPAAS
jgi:uncharacterized protein (TIGR02246 family)